MSTATRVLWGIVSWIFPFVLMWLAAGQSFRFSLAVSLPFAIIGFLAGPLFWRCVYDQIQALSGGRSRW